MSRNLYAQIAWSPAATRSGGACDVALTLGTLPDSSVEGFLQFRILAWQPVKDGGVPFPCQPRACCYGSLFRRTNLGVTLPQPTRGTGPAGRRCLCLWRLLRPTGSRLRAVDARPVPRTRAETSGQRKSSGGKAISIIEMGDPVVSQSRGCTKWERRHLEVEGTYLPMRKQASRRTEPPFLVSGRRSRSDEGAPDLGIQSFLTRSRGRRRIAWRHMVSCLAVLHACACTMFASPTHRVFTACRSDD